MIQEDVDSTGSYLTERMAEAFRSLSGRDYALGGTLSVILLFVVMNGVGFLSTSPLKEHTVSTRSMSQCRSRS